MDLLDFDQTTLYFDEPLMPEVEELIKQAGEDYGQMVAEGLLHRAYFRAPESLLVLVALYRYYFYQHRLEEALDIAERTLRIVGPRLGFPEHWEHVRTEYLGQAVLKSMGLLRFYLHVLKAAGYVNLRLGRFEQGRPQITKLIELDGHDRMGGRALLEIMDHVGFGAAGI